MFDTETWLHQRCQVMFAIDNSDDLSMREG